MKIRCAKIVSIVSITVNFITWSIVNYVHHYLIYFNYISLSLSLTFPFFILFLLLLFVYLFLYSLLFLFFSFFRFFLLIYFPSFFVHDIFDYLPVLLIFLHTNRITHTHTRPAVRVFANGPGDLGSIPGRVIPKTLKMELDTTLLNTQHYKARFKGKVEQSWEWSSALPYTLV